MKLLTINNKFATFNDKLIYVFSESPPSDEPETTALLARFDVQPSDSLKTLINTTIKNLKDGGLWTKLDVFKLYCMHTVESSLLNWKANAFNSTLLNSPTWTEKLGVTAISAGSCINTNYNAYSDAEQFLKGDGFCGGYYKDDIAGSNNHCFGCDNNLNNYTTLRPKNSIAQSRGTITGTVGLTTLGGSISASGLHIMERKLSTHIHLVKDGVVGSDVASTEVSALLDLPFYNLATNRNGGVSAPVIGQTCQGEVIGGGFSPEEHSSLYTIMKYFIDNVGGTF